MKRRVLKSGGMMSQMNVVPYIDVMLVLLIIFMVTAPMFNPGTIDLPSVSKSNQVTKQPVVINFTTSGFEVVYNSSSYRYSSNVDMVSQVRKLSNNEAPVVLSADKGIEYGSVISVVDSLYLAGVKQVGLVVKQK